MHTTHLELQTFPSSKPLLTSRAGAAICARDPRHTGRTQAISCVAVCGISSGAGLFKFGWKKNPIKGGGSRVGIALESDGFTLCHVVEEEGAPLRLQLCRSVLAHLRVDDPCRRAHRPIDIANPVDGGLWKLRQSGFRIPYPKRHRRSIRDRRRLVVHPAWFAAHRIAVAPRFSSSPRSGSED